MGTSRNRSWSVLLIALAAVLAMLTPATSVAQPGDAEAAAVQVEPAVARIDTTIEYQNAFGTGTGTVIDPGGQVLTNYHVVGGADTIDVTVGDRSYAADLIGFNRRNDIAVLQLRGAAGLPTAPLGDSGQLTEDEPVVALGNSGGTDGPLVGYAGTVVGFNRAVFAEDTLTGSSDELTNLIEFAAPVRSGDSGGPLLNGAGQVVGITTAASVNFQFGEPGGAGFAIPINQALPIANQIRSRIPSDTVHVGQPTLLGVGVAGGESDIPGVIIQEVLVDGPAQRAGLLGGDVLTSIDGSPVNSATALTAVLDRRYAGDVVDVTWIDTSGAQRTGKATLVAGP